MIFLLVQAQILKQGSRYPPIWQYTTVNIIINIRTAAFIVAKLVVYERLDQEFFSYKYKIFLNYLPKVMCSINILKPNEFKMLFIIFYCNCSLSILYIIICDCFKSACQFLIFPISTQIDFICCKSDAYRFPITSSRKRHD